VIVRVMENLEAKHFCVSYDIDSGDCWKFAADGTTCLKRGLGSELGIRNNLEKTEYYQPITALKKARWADTRSICRPAFDEEGLAQVRDFLLPPAPPPPVASCPAPTPGPLSKFDAKVHNHGPNWTTLDSTPLVGPDQDFCAAIGFRDGRRFCPPRAEGTPEAELRACNELVVGEPFWTWNGARVPKDGEPGQIEGVQHDDNPYHLLVRPTLHGTATVCGKNDVCETVIL